MPRKKQDSQEIDMFKDNIADIRGHCAPGTKVVLISNWFEEKGFSVYYGPVEEAGEWIQKMAKKNGIDSLRRIAKSVAARVFKNPDGSSMVPELIKDMSKDA